jgi:PAS domain S-box-containing protein
VTGLVLTLVNVTQRKLAEEALWKTHHELEARVAERTRELSAANLELKAEIAERRQAEERLRESEQKYKTLVETSRDMIFTVDLTGKFLFTNQAFGEVLGYSSEEMERLSGFELVHPDDLSAVKQQFARLVEGDSLDNIEYRYRKKDGSYINVLNSATPVFDSDGNVAAAFGVARDITRRKRAEKALQESELWMRNMFNSLEEAVFVLTPERALVDVNQAAQKMFGYSKEELVDFSAELLHVDQKHYAEFGRRIEKAFEEGKAASFEFQAKRKNGEIFPTEHTVALLKNDAGQSLGIVSVVRDVTERRRTEEQLSRYREHLEELVGERTAELKRTNERLGREISERKQAEEGLEWELAVNRELTQLSEALIKGWSSIPSIANIVLDSAKSLTQSEHGYVSSIDPETGDHIAHTLTEMMGKQCKVRREDRRIRFALGADGLYPSLWGYSLNCRKAFFTNSPAEHEASRGAPDGHIRIRNFLSVPAIIGKELVGQIALANSDRAYTDRHLDAIRRLAELYAIAIQRRRAEEALAAEREFTERALSAQTDTFFVFEPSTGRAVRWNKAFREVSGYSDQEIRSMKAPQSYYGEDDLRKAAVASERILREGIATVELSLITKDGRSIPTEYTGSAMRDSQGKPMYIIAVGRDISERKRSEEKIRQQNEFLENIIESLTHPFFVIDAHDYTIKAANSAALVDGKPGTLKCYAVSHDRSSPCQGEEHPCPLAELKKTKKPVVVEHIHYDGEGNFRTVEVYGYPIFDRRGDVAQMIEYCLDVTERKLAEQALRESEEKFRGLAEQSPNMIFINRKGRVVYANRRCEEIMGYKREEFYSPEFDFLEMVAPECKDLVTENFSKHGRGEEVRPYEYTLCTKDGKQIEAILNSRLITYAGEPAILGIVTDITERKHVEQELRKRSYDLGERIKELNCLYLISNLVERPGISLEDILHGAANLIPAAWEYPEITCARVILEDEVFLTSNFRETSWNQSTEIIVHGNPVGSVEVGYLEERPEKDEGPFLAEERSLLKAIAERLGRVVERTQAREEVQKLNASLKAQAHELAAANKELEAFSYSVSHDLRAPLRTVEGFSQALLEDYADKIDPNGKEYLQRVRSATQRMGQLIDDLLNLSLTMRREMRRERTDLSELALGIKAELQKAEPERRVDFVIQDRVWAQGDARLLRELLENLLGNAWKFTGKTPDARIEFGAQVQGDQEVYFVRDNGAGFDMNYADKLFVPFQRLHSESEFAGNGIGLALVSRIVNRHGGRIWAEGQTEKGAAFYFTLQ